MKILIVEDEFGPRQELLFHLGELCPDALILEADGAAQVYARLEHQAFDAVFLDINLPGESGLSIAMQLAELPQPPLIVFATAYDKYAVKAFELSALDYVVKPFSVRRLEKTVARLRQAKGRQQALQHQQQQLRELAAMQSGTGDASLWVVQDNGNRKLLPLSELVYAEARDKRVLLHCADGQCWDSGYTLKELEQKLANRRFCRIHKGYLLNLDFVSELVPGFAGRSRVRLRLDNSRELPVSRRQLATLKQCTDWR